jgi:hypothetical protein
MVRPAMTIRDVQVDMGYQPPTSSSKELVAVSLVGQPATFFAPNSIDSAPYGAALTELTALDTILSAGGQNFFVEDGVGQGMKLVIDWVVAPAGGTSIQAELITSAATTNASLSSGTVMMNFGTLPTAMFYAGYRQIMALPRSASWQRFLSLQIATAGVFTAGSFVSWLALDIDSTVSGYASGFTLK